MKYDVEIKKRAVKDLKGISSSDATKIIEKMQQLENDLAGDVKKLTNFTPEYRLRVGNYRVLFEVEDSRVIVYRVKHRREAYQ